jgi:hypothetical protein
MTPLDTHRYIGLNITQVQEHAKHSSMRNRNKKLESETAPCKYGAVFIFKSVIYKFI